MTFPTQVMYCKGRLGARRKNETRKKTKAQKSCFTSPNDSNVLPSSLTVSLDKSIWRAAPARSIDILVSRMIKSINLPEGNYFKNHWLVKTLIDCYYYVNSVLSIIIIVTSFVELVEYFSGLSVFLGNRVCQDRLENFFGQQRQRGRASEHPCTTEFLRNTQALRVISNTCKGIRGNCLGGAIIKDQTYSEPLPKRQRKGHNNII